ncbi:hypothetical protein D3C85_1822350 [compost metagenome]
MDNILGSCVTQRHVSELEAPIFRTMGQIDVFGTAKKSQNQLFVRIVVFRTRKTGCVAIMTV